jgi:hypothetical protein
MHFIIPTPFSIFYNNINNYNVQEYKQHRDMALIKDKN